MTAEPAYEPVNEPEAILQALPAEWRDQFLSEYREALRAAHEVWRYHQIRDVLQTWRLRAMAFSDPDIAEAIEDLRAGRREKFVPAERAIPGWPDRL